MTPILLSDPKARIGFLKDALKCSVTEERNGVFELKLEYPVTGKFFKEIVVDRIIKAKPNDTAENQLFRIYDVGKPINGTVTVNAEHISYALSHYPVDCFSTNGGKVSAMTAMNAVLSAAGRNLRTPHGFSVKTCDITTTAPFEAVCCSARAALGGIEGSILDTYGGEFEFDNFKISLYKKRGKNTGVRIVYGKNMTAMQLNVSTQNSYTGIFPYCYDKDNNLITLSEKTLSVSNNSGIAERILNIDLSDRFEDGEEKTAEALRAHAVEYLENNDINAVDGSMTVSMVDLSKTKGNYSAALEAVSLCDTVKVLNQTMNVSLAMKVVKTVYDSIAERYESLELGTPHSNFADTIKQATKEAAQAAKKAIGISKLVSEFNAAIDDATAAITGASGGNVILNPSEHPQEILILCDSAELTTAKKLWRFNSAGLAFSSNGYNGPFGTSLLGDDGKLVINNVTARQISADLIRAGTIMSADANMLINLDEGTITTENFLLDAAGKMTARNAKLSGTLICGGEEYCETEIAQAEIRMAISDVKNLFVLAPKIRPNYGKNSEGSVEVQSAETFFKFTCKSSSQMTPIGANGKVPLTNLGFWFIEENDSLPFCQIKCGGIGSGWYNGLNGWEAFSNLNSELTIDTISTNPYYKEKFAGLTHHRVVNSKRATAAFGIGVIGNNPTAALELKESDTGTILARLDVYNSGFDGVNLRCNWYGKSSKPILIGENEILYDGAIVLNGRNIKERFEEIERKLEI